MATCMAVMTRARRQAGTDAVPAPPDEVADEAVPAPPDEVADEVDEPRAEVAQLWAERTEIESG